MLIRTYIASAILLALAGLGVSQQKPDFSGEWTLNRQASTLSPGAAAVQSGVVRIEHRDPTFRYKAAFVSASGPCNTSTSCSRTGATSAPPRTE